MGLKKGTKITDPAVLERLRKARIKALETRRANASKRKAAKELQSLEKKKNAALVQKKLNDLKQSESKSEPIPVENKTPESKPESEPKPKKKKKKQKRVRFVEPESSSTSEEEIVIRRRRPRRRRRRYSYSEAEVQEPMPVQKAKPVEKLQKENLPPVQKPPLKRQKSRRELALDAMYKSSYGKRFR